MIGFGSWFSIVAERATIPDSGSILIMQSHHDRAADVLQHNIDSMPIAACCSHVMQHQVAIAVRKRDLQRRFR